MTLDKKNVVSLRQENTDYQQSASTAGKILPLESLPGKALQIRNAGKRVALCHGVFDLLHIGHIRHLKRARQEADVLIVSVTADEFVNKGPGRPVFNHLLRAENLAALECVDYVAINFQPTAINVIEAVRPHVYVKGSDYSQQNDDVTGNIAREQRAVERFGGRIFFTQELTSSSSRLLNEHFQVFSPETKAFLDGFKETYSYADVAAAVEKLADSRVLVVGDAIIDQYHYTSSLGQTGKGNVLAVKYHKEESFAGGSVAVANHLAEFAKSVTLVCGLGARDSYETFIRSKLRANVEPEFFINPDAGTLIKRRYVGDDMAKLFEVYYMDESLVTSDLDAEICAWLDRHAASYDAVIVPDFGNGFISSGMTQVMSDRARFLAVNTQINSANRGFHAVTRYPCADFISLNEPELRLAAGERAGDLETIGKRIIEKLSAKQLAVTRGVRGVLMLDAATNTSYAQPALSGEVIDRIGAGDAFLSLAGLSLSAGLAPELAGFLGNVAAALNVQIVCNREAVQKVSLLKYVDTLLK
jgi:rfaE bifunctional protein kinase chain/domain/rfaE bifunctional protein nucleotidyltransferase chain/domain